MTIYFIGAGPGDPELITLKGQRLLHACPVVLYAGSLIPPPLLAGLSLTTQIINTAALHLEQIITHMQLAHQKNQDVARLHSGDLSLYGAIGEQMARLKSLKIPYEIIPGVGAAAASAAQLGIELTLPGISQTVIFTRFAAKTPMPEKEQLHQLAQHGATLVIFLSVAHIHKIRDILLPHYGPHCPVAVVYKASWPENKQVLGTLDTIVSQVRTEKITRTALIIVGQVVNSPQFDFSYLYNQSQAHLFRPKYKRAHE